MKASIITGIGDVDTTALIRIHPCPRRAIPRALMGSPTLYVFSGLPGSGKTTLAQRVAQRLGAVMLRIDTVEQGLRDLCGMDVEGEGYRLSYRIAEDNLRLGLSVVADSCNPWTLTRTEWRDVAARANARAVDIEVVCADLREHRHRVETREVSVPGLVLPTWQQVVERDYEPCTTDRLVVDTASRTVEDCLTELFDLLEELAHVGPAAAPRA